MTEERYDCIVVGGGPAGLAAAIHLAWHDRRALVIDRRTGPLFFTIEELYNVPGMPDVRGVDLQKRLRSQALERGAEVVRGNVVSASGSAGDFVLKGEKGEVWRARTLLLATGVARYHPTADGDYRPCFAYAGKGNLCYCIDCEGPTVRDKATLVIGVGSGRAAAQLALGLSRYTDRIHILLTSDPEIEPSLQERLSAKEIDATAGTIRQLIGRKRHLEALVLESGERLDAEAFFVSSPALGRTDLAQQLGVEMADTGYHARPKTQRGDTSVEGVWIAGDLRPMTQQVAVAMGTGNLAAVMIDQYLRRRDVAG
jgi:thioredoxin reductase